MRTSLEIPLHRLADDALLGIEIHAHGLDFDPGDRVVNVHRDDHYTFGFLESGRVNLMVDFETLDIGPGSAFFLLPGQVHQLLDMECGKGWFIAMDASLVSDLCRPVFECQNNIRAVLPLCSEQVDRLRDCARLLHSLHAERGLSPLHNQLVRQVASSYAGMMAAAYGAYGVSRDRVLSRYGFITQSFRHLLAQSYKAEKGAAWYADKLHLSVNYLNEAVRAETGLPVRYWIQHTVMLEARRLLYYTPLHVKEVAHALGYEDHAYFTRLFTKVTGVSPGAFRRR